MNEHPLDFRMGVASDQAGALELALGTREASARRASRRSRR